MARLVTSGFETQRLSAINFHGEGQGAATIGTPTISTSVKRTGAASLSSNANGSYVQFQAVVSVLDRTYFGRCYARFDSVAPASNSAVFGVAANATSVLSIRLKTNGTLGLYEANGTQVGSDSAALSANTWYRLEFELMIPTTLNGTAGFWLDGTEVARSTNVDVNNSIANGHMRVGPHIGGAVQTYLDDVALNDNQGANQNGRPGPGSVYLLKPVSDNAVGIGWEQPATLTDVLDLWQSVDNTPPVGVAHSDVDANNLLYIFNDDSIATSNYDANLQTYDAAGIPSGDVITLVQPLVRTGSSSATDTSGAYAVVSNPNQGAETTFNAFDQNVAATDSDGATPNWKTLVAPPVYSPSVTRGISPVLRVGKRQNTTRVAMVDLMGLYVESAPSSGSLAITSHHRRRAHRINR